MSSSSLECYILLSEPGCLQFECTTHGIVGVHGTGEYGDAIALEGDVVYCLAEQDSTVAVQRLDGHIDILLVSGQEQVAKPVLTVAKPEVGLKLLPPADIVMRTLVTLAARPSLE